MTFNYLLLTAILFTSFPHTAFVNMTADDTGGGMHPSTNSLKSQTKLSNPTPTVTAQPLSNENDMTIMNGSQKHH